MVHLSATIASRTFFGSKASAGMTTAAPLIIPAKTTQMQPNMWDRGTERQSRSFSVNL